MGGAELPLSIAYGAPRVWVHRPLCLPSLAISFLLFDLPSPSCTWHKPEIMDFLASLVTAVPVVGRMQPRPCWPCAPVSSCLPWIPQWPLFPQGPPGWHEDLSPPHVRGALQDGQAPGRQGQRGESPQVGAGQPGRRDGPSALHSRQPAPVHPEGPCVPAVPSCVLVSDLLPSDLTSWSEPRIPGRKTG